jgi:hypothetical protein
MATQFVYEKHGSAVTVLSHSPGFCPPRTPLVHVLHKNRAIRTTLRGIGGPIISLRIKEAGMSTTASFAPRREGKATPDQLWMIYMSVYVQAECI